jgi:hypothetical protein
MSYTDLSGVFYVQQRYLTDLSALSAGTDVSNYVSTLQSQLTDAYGKYSTANISSAAVLDHQSQMNTIIQAENNRLNEKKKNVDDALFAQQRVIAFNESYRKKYRTQIDILIVIAIALLLYLGLILLEKNVPSVPGFVIGLLKVAVITVSFILVYLLITKINKRDQMDFDKLTLSVPTSGNAYVTGNTTSSGTTSDYGGYCAGSACCATGTTWSNSDGKCIVSGNTSGFRNIAAEPFTSYEFSSYGDYSKK